MSFVFEVRPANAVRPCILPHGDGVVFSTVCHFGNDLELQLIHIPDGETCNIALTDDFRVGRVYSVRIRPFNAKEWLYRYRSAGRWILDPMAFSVQKITLKQENENSTSEDCLEVEACSCFPLRASELLSEAGGQQEPLTPLPPADWADQVVYGLHVKGLTAAKEENFPGRGTFTGVSAMIPYLKELGATAVEIMPVYLTVPERKDRPVQYKTMEEALRAWPVGPKGDPLRDMKERPNYWGFGRGFYYALRPEYGTQDQFAQMIRDFHDAGMRVILQFHFTKLTQTAEQIEIIRFYLSRFGVDGFRLMGHIPSSTAIASDPSLTDAALFFDGFPPEEKEDVEYEVTEILGTAHGKGSAPGGPGSSGSSAGNASLTRSAYPGKKSGTVKNGESGTGTDADAPAARPCVITCKDDFQTLLRCFVKSDEYVMKDFLKLFLAVPASSRGILRYAAGHEGFTLADLVSYNERHNEANGEFGLDGIADNYSWNCGEEGETTSEEILSLRRKQIRNFLTLLFLSQGTPLIWQGDERMNSQGGNNNPYCQDNETSWTDWSDSREKRSLTELTRRLAEFKRDHPVFRSKKPFQYIDYLGIGYPDVSLHGARAWMPDLGAQSHSIGIAFCENYNQKETPGQIIPVGPGMPVFNCRGQKKQPAFIYLAINMYWEEVPLALPRLPVYYCWKVCFDTEEEKGFLDIPMEIQDRHQVFVAPRSIRILRAFPDPDTYAKDREKERIASLPPEKTALSFLRRGHRRNSCSDPGAKTGGLKNTPGTARILRTLRKILPPKDRGKA